MGVCTIRLATRDDAEAINSIQNYYVERSTATFLTEPLTLQERLAWLHERSPDHPVTVALSEGAVVGWGALGTFRPRAAYARTAELSVYVHHEWHRRGIGRAVILDLLTRARALEYHALVGGCCSEATPSVALLEALGFSRVGHFPEVGRKFGRWLDVVFLQRLL